MTESLMDALKEVVKDIDDMRDKECGFSRVNYDLIQMRNKVTKILEQERVAK